MEAFNPVKAGLGSFADFVTLYANAADARMKSRGLTQDHEIEHEKVNLAAQKSAREQQAQEFNMGQKTEELKIEKQKVELELKTKTQDMFIKAAEESRAAEGNELLKAAAVQTIEKNKASLAMSRQSALVTAEAFKIVARDFSGQFSGSVPVSPNELKKAYDALNAAAAINASLGMGNPPAAQGGKAQLGDTETEDTETVDSGITPPSIPPSTSMD